MQNSNVQALSIMSQATFVNLTFILHEEETSEYMFATVKNQRKTIILITLKI